MQINVGSLQLTPKEAAWLDAICNLTEEGRRVRIAEAWRTYLEQERSRYTEEIDAVARLNETTWEAAFILLVNRRPVGNGKFARHDILWAEAETPMIFRSDSDP